MSHPHQNGKGSKNRTSNFRAYGEGWDRVFGGKDKDRGTVKVGSCKKGLTLGKKLGKMDGV